MRALTLLIAVLALAPAFAGCVTGTVDDTIDPTPTDTSMGGVLPAVPFGVLDGESVWITSTADGTKLHTRLFLPELATDPAWRAPTILVMSPYFGYDAREDQLDASSRPTYFRYTWLIDHFVPRGYVVAFSDVRGTGDSGGCLEQTAELQRQDGHDIVEWLAAEPWSNQRVGMFGKSYDAETQQGAAITTPPHLTTIIPVASVSGQYEWNFYDGVPLTLHTLMGNAFYMEGDGLQAPTTPEGLTQYPTRVGCHPGMLAQAAKRDGDWDAYWASREFRPHVGNIEASVLYVHGFQDWNVRQVAIRDWFDQIPSEKRAIFGQWAHDYPEANSWNDEWNRVDWRDTVEKWYDYWLLDIQNGILDALPAVQIQDSNGVWRAEPTYPPTDATNFTLHLVPGALAADAPGENAEMMYLRENDEAFLRANTGLPVPTGESAPYAEELVFISEPFAADTHFSGWPVLEMDLALIDGLYPDPDAITDAHFAANMWLVAPDGKATWINVGYLSARHRDGVDKPAPVPEDDTLTYRLRFSPADTVIPAGHSIKMTLAGSDAQSEPEGTFWGAEIKRGTLTFPVIERDWSAVTLPVEFGKPVRS